MIGVTVNRAKHYGLKQWSMCLRHPTVIGAAVHLDCRDRTRENPNGPHCGRFGVHTLTRFKGASGEASFASNHHESSVGRATLSIRPYPSEYPLDSASMARYNVRLIPRDR